MGRRLGKLGDRMRPSSTTGMEAWHFDASRPGATLPKQSWDEAEPTWEHMVADSLAHLTQAQQVSPPPGADWSISSKSRGGRPDHIGFSRRRENRRENQRAGNRGRNRSATGTDGRSAAGERPAQRYKSGL
jgi:hypothetical protein